MNRRGFLKSILAAGVAPYVCTTAGVLMPVRDLWKPKYHNHIDIFPPITMMDGDTLSIAWSIPRGGGVLEGVGEGDVLLHNGQELIVISRDHQTVQLRRGLRQ